jgi:signal transduction histidine kinase/ligand-binding sensor domain-containing protein
MSKRSKLINCISIFYCSNKRFLLIFALGFINLIYSQPQGIKFDNLTSEDGLSQNSVIKIFQDSRDFLWFGTFDGVNRYDGYNFRIFKSVLDDSTSISGLNFNSICEDKYGNIWFGSLGGGISEYNRNTETFKRYVSDKKNINSPVSNYIRDLIFDNDGNLWIATEGGLDRLNPGTKKFTHFQYDPLNINSIGSNYLLSLGKDAEGNIWVGTGYSVDRYDKTNNKFIRYTLMNNSIGGFNKIYLDRSGEFWFGSNDGLCRFDKKNNNLVLYPNKNPIITNPGVREILEDVHGNFWVAYFSGGLFNLNKSTGVFTLFTDDQLNKVHLSTNIIASIFEDRSGILWIGTLGSGINKLDFRKLQFRNISFNSGNRNGLSDNKVYSLIEVEKGFIWIGTYGGGLNKYNPKSSKNNFEIFNHNNKDPKSLRDNGIYSLMKDKNGIIWIGTQSGLDYYDTKINKFIRDKSLPSLPGIPSEPTVFTIMQSSSGEIWIGTYSGGFFVYNPKDKTFKNYTNNPDDPKSLSNYTVRYIYEDKSGIIWICTDDGLNKFDRIKNEFIKIKNDPSNPNSISSNTILNIFEDRYGNMWIGTTVGLNKLIEDKSKPNAIKFIRYTKNEGLPDNYIQGILEDNSGNLWISTNKGLSKFNINKKAFINYKEDDGLLSDEFYINSLCKIKNTGEFVFGGNEGFCIFNPDKIKDDDLLPPVVLTNLMIFNQTVPVGKKFGKDIILNKSITETENLVLSYSHNVITFEYSALHYASPKSNQYAYYMQGLESGWNFVGNRRYATYSNLPPGEYIFRVKAANISGIWNEKGTSLKITIIPPFWQTWFFRTISIMVIILLTIMGYRLRINSIREREKQLEQFNVQLQNENKERKRSEEAVEKYAEELTQLNATKDKFFSIIAHDLKNPFNAIINSSKLMANDYDSFQKKDHLKFLDLIYKSSEAAYNLLENLLLWARSQSGRIHLEKNYFDLSIVIKETVELLNNQAEAKRIKINSNIKQETNVYADIDTVNTVVRNLLSNAIKFTNSGGSIKIDASESDKEIRIDISDNGVGMSKDEVERLFRIDVNLNKSGTAGEKGTGLGLILCKEFIEKNNGKLWVVSQIGKGSTFSFTLPIASNF